MDHIAPQTIHASCVAIQGVGVLIEGASGSGKSDLALRLIDRGARLVSDDYTLLTAGGDGLVAAAPPTIAGQIEMRGIGIVAVDPAAPVRVALLVSAGVPDRMPAPRERRIAGVCVPELTLALLEASAPIKVETALARILA